MQEFFFIFSGGDEGRQIFPNLFRWSFDDFEEGSKNGKTKICRVIWELGFSKRKPPQIWKNKYEKMYELVHHRPTRVRETQTRRGFEILWLKSW
ncbi:unnamed protein product [Lactuca virosa]|uniref:Uncharacterized protein n=1 Tax=Lactuca virosa TaxID=75947 RepID=A0AAU9NJN2_9ASTR|nr:unnamed protein product [Lactuca virosa]